MSAIGNKEKIILDFLVTICGMYCLNENEAMNYIQLHVLNQFQEEHIIISGRRYTKIVASILMILITIKRMKLKRHVLK